MSFLFIHLYHVCIHYIFSFVHVCIHYNNNNKAIKTVADQIVQATVPKNLDQLLNFNDNDRESQLENLATDRQSEAENQNNDGLSVLEKCIYTYKPKNTQSSTEQKKNDDYPYNATSYLYDYNDYNDYSDPQNNNNTTAMERDDYNDYSYAQNNTTAMERDDYNDYSYAQNNTTPMERDDYNDGQNNNDSYWW